MSDPAPLADEMELRDVETIKVFADARRLQILELMRRPTTVKAVGEALDTPPSKLYYHVNLLLEHGLIQVVDHNIDTGIVEKVYQVTARRFRLTNPLVSGGAVPDEASAALFSAMLDETRRGFLQAFAGRDSAESTPPRHPFLSRKEFRLTEAQLTALHARLDALIQDVTALGAANEAGTEPAYALTVVFYRQPDDA